MKPLRPTKERDKTSSFKWKTWSFFLCSTLGIKASNFHVLHAVGELDFCVCGERRKGFTFYLDAVLNKEEWSLNMQELL